MAGTGVEIKVEGLKEFSKALKQADKELPKQLRIALNDVSGLVVDDAVPGVPKRSGRAARSLKAQSTRTKARVAGGGGRVPYYPWLDFGGSVGPGGGVKRQFRKRGRYLYKSYFKLRDSGEFTKALELALSKVASKAGLVVD